MPKDEELENTKDELEKTKEEMKKAKVKKNKEELEVSTTTPEQPIRGRGLIWTLLFGMVFSFIAAFVSIILRQHGVI